MSLNHQRILAPIPPSSKKFRFDSFAEEFSENNIKKEPEYFPDNDSGIDSEETQTSPRILSSTESSPQEPLSLVIRDISPSSATGSSTPPVRHWKKCLKDQASPPLSGHAVPVKQEVLDQPENLCIHDEQNKITTTKSQVAHALLSLGNQVPSATLKPRPSIQTSCPLAPSNNRAPFKPLPIQLVPTRPLNMTPVSNYHRFFNDAEPENLSSHMQTPTSTSTIKLPQHPVLPLFQQHQNNSSNCNNIANSNVLKESSSQNKPKKTLPLWRMQKKFCHPIWTCQTFTITLYKSNCQNFFLQILCQGLHLAIGTENAYQNTHFAM